MVFQWEINTRAGFSSIKGGRTLVTDIVNARALNFHAGYDQGQVFSAKGQVRFTYNIYKNIGLHIGGYYLRHFDAEEAIESGVSAGHEPFTSTSGNHVLNGTGAITRTTAQKSDIASIGIFAGASIKIPMGRKRNEKKDKKEDKNYLLIVTAKDKYSKVLLPETDIALKDINGNVIKTATTNALGIVMFNDIVADNYTIEGALYDIELEKTALTKSEFGTGNALRKEILYADMNFILKGNSVKCNTVAPLANVSVILKDKEKPLQKTTLTDKKGTFLLRIEQHSEYSIHGKKEKFFSQTETISTGEYDRNTTLFVKLEMCMEKADCGMAIRLNNIHYDLGAYDIREDAKPELDRLVQFMNDNPSVDVEVASHTDASGSHAHNQVLSYNRARAAVAYLVSQGILKNRLTGTGYGENKLLNECADGISCPQYKHQRNRRTEMKVICYK